MFLAYRLPREPSTPRITLWRKLRRLGAVQVVDNLVALPLDARTREQFEWLADEVVEAGGEASIWMAETATAAQEREIASRMAAAVAEEYRRVIDAASAAAPLPTGRDGGPWHGCAASCARSGPVTSSHLAEAEQARQAVEALATTTELVR